MKDCVNKENCCRGTNAKGQAPTADSQERPPLNQSRPRLSRRCQVEVRHRSPAGVVSWKVRPLNKVCSHRQNQRLWYFDNGQLKVVSKVCCPRLTCRNFQARVIHSMHFILKIVLGDQFAQQEKYNSVFSIYSLGEKLLKN